jgi:transposase
MEILSGNQEAVSMSRRESQPKARVVELDVPQLEAQLDEIERTMGEPMSRPFRLLLASYLSVLATVKERNISIDRLRRMLFGASTERTRDVAAKVDATAAATATADNH